MTAFAPHTMQLLRDWVKTIPVNWTPFNDIVASCPVKHATRFRIARALAEAKMQGLVENKSRYVRKNGFRVYESFWRRKTTND